MAKLNQGQLKKIWVSAKQAGLEEIDLRKLIKNLTGSNKISTLSSRQANKVINALTGNVNYRKGFISEKQLWKIQELSKGLGWDNDPKRLKGFVKKYAGVEDPRWLTSKMAWKIIEGLKKMKTRQSETLTKAVK